MLKIWSSATPLYLNRTVGSVVKQYPGLPNGVLKLSDTVPPLAKGEVLLAMGTKALEVLQQAGVVPKGRKVSSLRGTEFPYQGGSVFVTYDPRIIDREYSNQVDILWDVQLAIRKLRTGSIQPALGKYQYVKDFSHIIQYVEATYAKVGIPVPVTCDLETLGLVPYLSSAFIVSIAFTERPGTASVIRFTGLGDQPIHVTPDGGVHLANPDLAKQIQWLLNSPKVLIRGANFKYDVAWFWEKWRLRCENFKFDTTLVGSLLDENRSNGLNNHAKIYTPMGGYDDCVAPETLVCTWDLRWVPIETVRPGDKLLGFEEQCEPGKRRTMQLSEAVSTKKIMKPGYRVTFSNGVVVKCSDNHGWLAHTNTSSNGPFSWVHTRDLKEGARVLPILNKREALTTWDAGYVSGLYDGEGYVSYQRAGITSGVSQRPGVVWDRYESIMKDVGLGGYYARIKNTDGVKTSKHSGAATMEVLQLFRPMRLINKIPYVGKSIPSGVPKVWVVKVEDLGKEIECISLQTSTRTFVAEGLASHNSFNAQYKKSRMDLVPDQPLLLYAGGDTDACYQVSDKMRAELLRDPALARFYVKLLHPAVRAFERVEEEGVLIDPAYFSDLQKELEDEIKLLEKKALDCIPQHLHHKHAGMDGPNKPKMRLSRAAVIQDFLFGPRGLKLPVKMWTASGEKKDKKDRVYTDASTSMDHLLQFSEHPEAGPFIESLKALGSAKKTLDTYVIGFLKHLRPDSRFHPTYLLHRGDFGGGDDAGTVTGRSSARDPAVQCQKADAPVLTRGGYRPLGEVISEVRAGGVVEVKTHDGSYHKVVDTCDNGNHPIYRVASAGGNVVECTGNHPLLTNVGWVRADKIKVGFHQIICYSDRNYGGGYGRVSGSTRVSGVRNIERGAVALLGKEDPLEAGGPQGECWRERVCAIHSETRRRDALPVRPQAGCGGVSSEATRCNGGPASGWRPVEEPEHEPCVGDLEGEWAGHGAAWQEHYRGEEPPSQADGCRGCGNSTAPQAGDARKADSPAVQCRAGHDQPDKGWFTLEDVTSVDRLASADTFGIRVAVNASYVSGGIVVHNTIPKHTKWAKKLRKGYIAPPGFKVVNWDFSQGELRIAACVANEPNMIKLYREGIDLHMVTGGEVQGYTIKQMLEMQEAAKTDEAVEKMFKAIRQGGKAGNFGLLYGMGAKGFMEYAWNTYGVKLTLVEAEAFRDKFLNVLYPRLPKWHEEQKKLAHLHMAVRSKLGRVRHLSLINSPDNEISSKAERQSVNSVIQSMLSDFSIYSLARFQQKYGWQDTCRFFLFTHDSLTAYVREDLITHWVPRVQHIMENLPFEKEFGWKPALKFVSDAEVGDDLADTIEYAKWLKLSA